MTLLGLVSIQGLHSLKAAFLGQLCQSAVCWPVPIHQFSKKAPNLLHYNYRRVQYNRTLCTPVTQNAVRAAAGFSFFLFKQNFIDNNTQ